MTDSKPERYAVIGNPVAHSRSPTIHAIFAAQTAQHIEYGRIEAPTEGFVQAVDRFRAEGGRGLNVTVPFKQQAHAYAVRHTARAAMAGAVNTLVFEGPDVLGDNTDGAGLVADLSGRIGLTLQGARVLMLGAGGAARGVVKPLLDAGVRQLVIANRTAERAHDLCADLSARLSGAQAQALSAIGLLQVRGQFDLVINATAAGLSDAAPPVPPDVLAGTSLALDMVYAAQPTAFMRAAHAAGCPRTEDGLGMLVGQAAESFAVWRGVRPQTAPVYAALRVQLSAH
jgi:shikimate dehydrogenase